MFSLDKVIYKNWNERDLEGLAVIEFVKDHPAIKTALDVGAHWSWSYYAPELKKLIPNYDGIDILPDPQTRAIIDKYIVGDVKDYSGFQYDLVFSISSIEHSGISTYKSDDYRAERMRVFQKIVDLSKKYIFITFPFGQEAIHEGEFANITREDLDSFGNLLPDGSNLEMHFYFSESPFVDHIPYKEVNIDFASNVEYIPSLGTRCCCFLAIEKQ